ncbi:MAG TPA: hypothetical protein VFJ87_04880 [Rhodanobacteraceae bacterium]|nr:hypothetical protein [Rhodanobacteraceae bacterium]
MNPAQNNAPPMGAGRMKGTSQSHPPDRGAGLAIARCGTSLADGGDRTPPNFDCLPTELTSRPRWVLWRDGKVPHCATRPSRRASCTKPDTWASFEAARTAFVPGRDCGLGFVLGDGVAGVDIDHDTSEAAQFLLETVGCGYIERSPSGDGLHGWAFSSDKLPRCKGVLDGMHVEVYNRDRYFTVTGDTLTRGPLVHTDRILRLSMALQREARNDKARQVAGAAFSESSGACRFSESYESTESSEDHVEQAPEQGVNDKFLPKKTGERNSKLFQWCRHMKTLNPNATVAQQIQYANQWYWAAKQTIGTKDAAVTIDDFMRGWAVALPESFGVDAVAEQAAGVPVPRQVGEALGNDALAYQLCVAMQRTTGEQPFFLPTRTLAAFLHTSQPTAAAALRILRALGVLSLAKEHTRTTAPRYYVTPEFLASSR